MKQSFFHRILLCLILIFNTIALTRCAAFENGANFFGDMFHGNTRKTLVDYDNEDKREYRKYKRVQKAIKNDEEREKLKYLDDHNGN